MKKRALVLIVLLAFSGLSYGQTVQEMMSNCRVISDAEILEGGNIRAKQTYASGQCWGAFAVLQELSRWVDDTKRPKDTAILKICAHEDTRRTQYVAVFMEYARRNPARWHEEFVPFAVESLQGGFPCRPR